MPRVTLSPGRDPAGPLVKIDRSASRAERVALWLLRSYLTLIGVCALLLIVYTILLVLIS